MIARDKAARVGKKSAKSGQMKVRRRSDRRHRYGRTLSSLCPNSRGAWHWWTSLTAGIFVETPSRFCRVGDCVPFHAGAVPPSPHSPHPPHIAHIPRIAGGCSFPSPFAERGQGVRLRDTPPTVAIPSPRQGAHCIRVHKRYTPGASEPHARTQSAARRIRSASSPAGTGRRPAPARQGAQRLHQISMLQ